MKFAVVGCGAVGSYYGAMLCRAGHDVHFLLRSDYEVVQNDGVQVCSPAGDFRTRPQCAKAPEEIGASDVVLIALKTTANAEFAKLLPPLVSPHTAVVTLQNGLGNEAQLARFFPGEQILGGLCFVCLNRTAPGVIEHLAHGLIVLGEFERRPEPRTYELAAAFENAGVPCKVTDNLARTHWEKLVWNVPFNGLGVASAAGYDALHQSTCDHQPCARRMSDDRETSGGRALGGARDANSWMKSSPRPTRWDWRLPHRSGIFKSPERDPWELTKLRHCSILNSAGRWNWKACFSNRCGRLSKWAWRCLDLQPCAQCCNSLTRSGRAGFDPIRRR